MLKRDTKLFFSCLASSLFLLILVGAVCFIGIAALSDNSDNSAIYVAVADNEDSAVSRILINAVRSTDYLSKLMQIEKMDEASAIEAVRGGEAAAGIILPENFVNDILAGRKSKGEIYLSDSVMAHGEIIASAARFGEKLLVAGQYGAFSAQSLLSRFPADYRADTLKKVNTALLNEALDANTRYIESVTTDYLDTEMSRSAYYFGCWIVNLLFLISIFFSELFSKDMTRGLAGRLSTYGIGFFRFFMPKLFLMFIFRFAILIIAVAIMPDTGGLSLNSILSTAATSAYITVVGAALTICFGDSITAPAITAIGGLFLCGGIVPKELLPAFASTIGQLTPFGGATTLAEPIFGIYPPISALVIPLTYAVISLILMRRKFALVLSGGDSNV